MHGKVSSAGAKPALCKVVLAVQMPEPELPPQYCALTDVESNMPTAIKTKT
jgi:trans-aconitate methyltransferase